MCWTSLREAHYGDVMFLSRYVVKFEDMNNLAKEAFAKSQIDIGVGIFKAIMLLVLVFPITLIIKEGVDGKTSPITPQDVLNSLDPTTYVTLISFLGGALVLAILLRNSGLKYLNKIEQTET
jgi:ABC-type long-subunit fatty acid transport system fused permease/ATPase subunit